MSSATVRICKSHVQKNGQNVPEDLAVALQKLSEEGKIPVGFYNATSYVYPRRVLIYISDLISLSKKFISKQLLAFKKSNYRSDHVTVVGGWKHEMRNGGYFGRWWEAGDL